MTRLIPDLFFDRVVEHPARPAVADPVLVGDEIQWNILDWRTYGDRVLQAAASLITLGISAGDRVAILGSNRSEWTTVDVAAMTIGAVPLGVFASCSAEQVGFVLDHSGSKLVVVENAAQLEKVTSVRPRLKSLVHVVVMDEMAVPSDVVTWTLFQEMSDTIDRDAIDARRATLDISDVATLVYTSGTTGEPKAVMLTHANLLAATGMGLYGMTERRADDTVLSYLPLAHVAERGISVLGPAAAGYCVYFCPRMELLPQCLRSVHPTIFLGVPRVWEKMRDVLVAKGRDGGLMGKLLEWAMSQNTSRVVRRRIAEVAVLRRVRAALGLDKAHTVVCGAAPADDELLDFFSRIGLEIRKIYGLTECSGPATINRVGEDRRGNVGRPFPSCEIRIANDGEILIRGPHVFRGYLNDPAATGASLDRQWLRSGDLGHLNPDGTLTVSGRKKEIIITSGGKNIAPSQIERAIAVHPAIADVIVIGDGKPYLTALITVSAADGAAAATRDIEMHVDLVNQKFSRAQQIKRFTILDQTFSISGGELTPTRKLRRSAIAAKFSEQIEGMYAPTERNRGSAEDQGVSHKGTTNE